MSLAARALVGQFRELGLDVAVLRRLTVGPDNLKSPLGMTRECELRDDPLAVAVRLFFCAREERDWEGAEALAEAGILERSDGGWVAPLHLRIVGGIFLFSDYLDGRADAVMGAGETTAVLYRAALPGARVVRVLDLGCGAGTLALLLARTADWGVGTDVNPRAVELGRLNAAANGIGNVEFRVGDLWDPVAGERFDLVVSQPPYYPIGTGAAAGERHTFLHGGVRGDELPMRVVEGMLAHLSTGGRGLVFTSWPEDRKMPESAGLRLLELRTNRRELHGTRQSIGVMEAADGDGWSASYEVPADAWGEVTRGRIDAMMADQAVLHRGDAAVAEARWRMPEGAVRFEEGGDVLVRCPGESLAGLAAVSEAEWGVMVRGRGEVGVVRKLVGRGLLTLV